MIIREAELFPAAPNKLLDFLFAQRSHDKFEGKLEV